MYYVLYETDKLGCYKGYESYESALKFITEVIANELRNLDDHIFLYPDIFLKSDYADLTSTSPYFANAIEYSISHYENCIVEYKYIHTSLFYVFYVIESENNFHPNNLRRENNTCFCLKSIHFPKIIKLIMN